MRRTSKLRVVVLLQKLKNFTFRVLGHIFYTQFPISLSHECVMEAMIVGNNNRFGYVVKLICCYIDDIIKSEELSKQ